MKPRSAANRGLPERWQLHHGAYYYRVPTGKEAYWGGKKRFKLGRTLSEAQKVYEQRKRSEAAETAPPPRANTIAQLLDRYLNEVVPKSKSPTTRADKIRNMTRLRATFGELDIDLPNWPQLFYQYAENRRKTLPDGSKIPALTAAHRELEVLSHAFTYAVRWGLLSHHPTFKEVRLDGDLALKPRERYIEDWEVVECLNLRRSKFGQKKGGVLMVQAYIKLKLATGLSKGDLLRLRLDEHIREDGIHVQRHKTKGNSGKRTVYEWTPERTAAVEEVKRVRPALSPYLFCNRRGEGYINEDTGECHGWDSMWSRFMDRVLAETGVKERFTEHDLRAKVGSDAESLEKARKLLQHADASTTQRIYRRKAERV
jgi:integrase